MPNTGRLYLREEGTAESTDSILVSTRPQAGAITMAGDAAIRPVSIDATFWHTTMPDASTEYMTGPITRPHFVVDEGWIANIYLLTMQTWGDGDDITACTAVFLDNGSDATASFNPLTLVPLDAAAVFATATPIAAPYVIDASAAQKRFTVQATTNGTGGTLEVLFHVLGYMYKVA